MGQRVTALLLLALAPFASCARRVLHREEEGCALCPASPMRYMLFASDYRKAGYDVAYVEGIVKRYGKNVIVGRDQGSTQRGMQDAVVRAKALGARLEVYLEGPGGPTGDKYWLKDEYERIRAAAKSLCGLNLKGTQTPQGVLIDEASMQKWNRDCWKVFMRKQVTEYAAQGYTAYEIDNLYRAETSTGVQLWRSDALIQFLQEQQRWHRSAGLARMQLVLKNMSPDNLRALAAATRDGRVPRGMLCDFHIWEEGSWNRKDRAQVLQLSAAIGIQTLISTDTYNYQAEGPYTLK